ncbi:hypothetical protein D3C71_1909710 [compost metagenome]
MAGQHTFDDIAGQRLRIHIGEIAGIFNVNFTDCTVGKLCCEASQLLAEREVRLKLVHYAWSNRRDVDGVDERLVAQNMQHLLRYVDSYVLLGFYG